jgi:RNA:NAD 2'-phosphotransferase (TPT1/KptA family)
MRMETVILETPKGRFRLCRDCYAAYGKGQLNKEYEESKKNIKLYGLTGTDAYEIIKEKEKFLKIIKG